MSIATANGSLGLTPRCLPTCNGYACLALLLLPRRVSRPLEKPAVLLLLKTALPDAGTTGASKEARRKERGKKKQGKNRHRRLETAHTGYYAEAAAAAFPPSTSVLSENNISGNRPSRPSATAIPL